MGTDYTLDDLAYQNIEDADYYRFPDEIEQGRAVYVVEATLKPFVDSEYTKSRVYIEKEHYIALRARYWDRADVEIKEATADADSIREFDGIWVATRSTMTDLKELTSSMTYAIPCSMHPHLSKWMVHPAGGGTTTCRFRDALRRELRNRLN